jgi:hypothetical protein
LVENFLSDQVDNCSHFFRGKFAILFLQGNPDGFHKRLIELKMAHRHSGFKKEPGWIKSIINLSPKESTYNPPLGGGGI